MLKYRKYYIIYRDNKNTDKNLEVIIVKLLVAGSRTITDFDLSEYIDSDVDVILSGGAKGIDCIAEKFADKKRLSKIILRPKYELYGKSAPLKRNEELVEMADKILVVWDGVSKGTGHTIEYAKKLDKEIKVVTK